MREIRFRAWDKLSQTMRDGAENNLVVCLNNPDFEVMQYTGLQDGMGDDIYEGDIVTFDSQKQQPRKVVAWREAGFNIVKSKKPRYVIGNIYENKELLK